MSGRALPEALQGRLSRLAPDQRSAATAAAGPVLCVAPAGSGKTTTLVARIPFRIATGADPKSVCALTFNKRAAEELAARLGDALEEIGVERTSVRVRTFHALGREILADAGIDVSRLVDRASLLVEVAGHPLPAATLRRLDEAFSRLRLDPERGPPAAEVDVHLAFGRYRAALVERRALDFDDLVARPLELLQHDPELLARWQKRCSTLLVDEVQDLDRTQLELALLLAGPTRDVFLVGDDDQTIYAWRLADVRRILGLAAALPGLRRVDLETNYRCPPDVVARSVRLIEHGVERFAKRIRASPRATGTLVLAPDTGDAVARARMLLGTWLRPGVGRHAVLARTNAELAPIAAAALEQGVPYHVPDDGLALDDPAIDHALEELRLLSAVDASGHSSDGWLPALAKSLRGTPGADGRLASAVIGWAAGARGPTELAAAIAEARRRRRELRRDDADLVLATVHTTKGLEFDHVAVIGMDTGTFPSERSVSEASDPSRALEEERRLAYVAWTRARRSLLLLFDPGAPSSFLLEAFDPDELGAA